MTPIENEEKSASPAELDTQRHLANAQDIVRNTPFLGKGSIKSVRRTDKLLSCVVEFEDGTERTITGSLAYSILHR